MVTRRARELFVAQLCRVLPRDCGSARTITDGANRLMRLGATHERLSVDSINGPDYDGCKTDDQRRERAQQWTAYLETLPAKIKRIRDGLHKVAATMSDELRIGFQNDPRGYTVFVIYRPTSQEFPIPTS